MTGRSKGTRIHQIGPWQLEPHASISGRLYIGQPALFCLLLYPKGHAVENEDWKVLEDIVKP